MVLARELYARDVDASNAAQAAYRERRRRHVHARPGLSPLAAAALVGGAVAIAALVGRRYSPDPSHPRIRHWYHGLRKPSFTPPDAAFGAVWPALELMLAISAYRLLRRPGSPERDAALALWVFNVAMIGGWTKLFFGERSTRAGFAAAAVQLGAGASYAVVARQVDSTSAGLAIPYVAWLAFASALSEEVWRRNA